MSTLLLRLAAPLQSWGVDSKFDIRATEKEPTKSGVLGILAAALGLRRDDTDGLAELAKLKFGVRVDREGKLLHDFHTAHSTKTAYVTHRYYLSDAVFLCGLSGDEAVLRKYADALQHPVYPLFLGRRSCPPTLPIVMGIRDLELKQALQAEPALEKKSSVMRIITDDPAGPSVVRDQLISFNSNKRMFGYRKRSETIIRLSPTTHDPFSELAAVEHDPFSGLEGEYVFDQNGT